MNSQSNAAGNGNKDILVARFTTVVGADEAVKTLQAQEKEGLLDIENTAVVTRNAWGKIDVRNVEEGSAWEGAKIGALVGGALGIIFPPSILASAALGGLVGGLATKMRETGFNPGTLHAMGESLEPGTSLLVTVIDERWLDEVQTALSGHAADVQWAVLDLAAQAAAAAARGTPLD